MYFIAIYIHLFVEIGSWTIEFWKKVLLFTYWVRLVMYVRTVFRFLALLTNRSRCLVSYNQNWILYRSHELETELAVIIPNSVLDFIISFFHVLRLLRSIYIQVTIPLLSFVNNLSHKYKEFSNYAVRLTISSRFLWKINFCSCNAWSLGLPNEWCVWVFEN